MINDDPGLGQARVNNAWREEWMDEWMNGWVERKIQNIYT